MELAYPWRSLTSPASKIALQALEATHVPWPQRSLPLRQREINELEQQPEIQALTAKMNAEHWRTWPDVPLPALHGQTPRQAATTPEGRERLEVLLLDFAARDDMPGSMGPDIDALRRELGI